VLGQPLGLRATTETTSAVLSTSDLRLWCAAARLSDGRRGEEAEMVAKRVRRQVPRIDKKHCLICGKPAKELYCDVCGQDHVERTRAKVLKSHQPGW
jgi:hypothetical protein